MYTNCSIVKPNQTNPLTVPIIPVCRVLRQIGKSLYVNEPKQHTSSKSGTLSKHLCLEGVGRNEFYFRTDLKSTVIENATTIVYRGCHYQQDGVPRDCRHTDNPKGIRTVYCMTCSTDGCNAALDFDLLKKSLLANTAITMSDSMNVSLIFVLLFNWLL